MFECDFKNIKPGDLIIWDNDLGNELVISCEFITENSVKIIFLDKFRQIQNYTYSTNHVYDLQVISLK